MNESDEKACKDAKWQHMVNVEPINFEMGWKAALEYRDSQSAPIEHTPELVRLRNAEVLKIFNENKVFVLDHVAIRIAEEIMDAMEAKAALAAVRGQA